MEKIIRLITILDEKVVDKLIMLDRLVHLYTKFLDLWRNVETKSDGANVRVKFFRINKYNYMQFTERIFPIGDIDKRINSYKSKIRKAFKERHNNPRLLREKKIRGWENYIKYANI